MCSHDVKYDRTCLQSIAQRDFNMCKRGTAWLKRGTIRAGMLTIPVIC